MKNILKIGLFLVSFLIFMSSCDDYLDTLPDNRAEVDTESEVIALLVSAYPNNNTAMMCEYWSDNIDNHDWNLNYNNYMEDLWTLKDQPSRSGNDTNYRSWELGYKAIASCNQALAVMEEMGFPATLKAARAEALIARAWNHFELANLFCLPYGETSSTDPGLVYMTAPETTVKPDYDRGTVEEFYKKIGEDIEAALPDIDNSIYTQVKFHFNVSAAYAFAAKYYLAVGNFDKVIEYSTKVLGSDPAQVLRDWQAMTGMDLNTTDVSNAYVDKNSPATLLASYPISGWCTAGTGPYSTGNKFSHSMLIAKYETLQSSGPWGNHNNIYIKTWWNSNTNKLFHRKIGYFFEYTDPVARTGYTHTSVVNFTTDEVLLHRAEAYILTKQYTKAYQDLTTFITNYTNSNPSYQSIIDFYKNMPYHSYKEVYEDPVGLNNLLEYPTPKKPLHPSLYQIEYGTDQEWLLHYVLHLKRVLLVGEGKRWFDVKRYGITVHRRLVDKGHM